MSRSEQIVKEILKNLSNRGFDIYSLDEELITEIEDDLDQVVNEILCTVPEDAKG